MFLVDIVQGYNLQGRQMVGIVKNMTPVAIQHRVASLVMRSLCQGAIPFVIWYPCLQG